MEKVDRRPMTVLKEECSGEGHELVFPNMSSCAAVICLLDDKSLVGIHKTLASYKNSKKSWEHARDIIKRRKILQMYVVGWITNKAGRPHFPEEIISFLVPDDNENWKSIQLFVKDYGKNKKSIKAIKKSMKAYTKAGKDGGGLCTFAKLNVDAMSVSIGFRQDQKVLIEENDKTEKWANLISRQMDVSIKSGSFYATKTAQIQSLDISENDDNDYTDLSFSMITPKKLDRRNQKYHYDQGATSNNVRGWRMIHRILNELELNVADHKEKIWT